MTDLPTTNVLILGLGASGLAMARWCAGQGARVRVWDSRRDPPQAAALAAEVAGSAFFSGELRGRGAGRHRPRLQEPGPEPGDERLAPLLQAARARGVPVRGELDLFSQALAQLKAERGYAPKVLAITGTNGKTTDDLAHRPARRARRPQRGRGRQHRPDDAGHAGRRDRRAGRGRRRGRRAGRGAGADRRRGSRREGRAGRDRPGGRARGRREEGAGSTPSWPPPPPRRQAEAAARRPRPRRRPPPPRPRAPRPAPPRRRPRPIPMRRSRCRSRPRCRRRRGRGVPIDADADATPGTRRDRGRRRAARTRRARRQRRARAAGRRRRRGARRRAAGRRRPPTLAEAAKLPDDDAPSITLIPPPPADPVFSHLPQVWVLELSSFQLDDVQDFNPSAATVLNVTQDHLDWHGTMDAYAAAKARIFGTDAMPDTVMVINRDDAARRGDDPAAGHDQADAARRARQAGVAPRGALRPRRAARAGRLRPGRRGRHGLAGARAWSSTRRSSARPATTTSW